MTTSIGRRLAVVQGARFRSPRERAALNPMHRWTTARTWVSLPGAIAVVAALTLGGPPASAASDERDDTVGDAVRKIDIASFSVRNGNSRAVITSHVPGLKQGGRFGFVYGYSRSRGLVVEARKIAGQLVVDVTYCVGISSPCPYADVDCPRLRARWSTTKHFVRAIIPQRCYPAALPAPRIFNAYSGSSTDFDDAGVLRVARG